MCQRAAWGLDLGHDVRNEVSMLKAFATEMASTTIDRAMQSFGAMGVSKELPLYLLAQQQRQARIYEGPTEVHISRVGRNLFAGRYQ